MIRKDYKFKEKEEIKNEINIVYQKLIKNNNTSSIIKIDLTNTKDKNLKQYNFRLRTIFNKIRKKFNQNFINYLYIIEYPKNISNQNFLINKTKLKLHSHIVIQTDISIINIIKSFGSFFNEIKTYSIYKPFQKIDNCDLYIEDITNRLDLKEYVNYLTKQINIFNNFSFNYKIKEYL